MICPWFALRMPRTRQTGCSTALARCLPTGWTKAGTVPNIWICVISSSLAAIALLTSEVRALWWPPNPTAGTTYYPQGVEMLALAEVSAVQFGQGLCQPLDLSRQTSTFDHVLSCITTGPSFFVLCAHGLMLVM